MKLRQLACIAALAVALPTVAVAQYSGKLPPSTVLGNDSGVSAPATPIARGLKRDGSNATLPTILQSLTLRTPGSCDGYYAQDGAITTGTANFSSASATFTAADAIQHKPISINGAGPTQYFGNATIAAAGTGYVPGVDEITLASGTSTQSATTLVRTTKVASATVAAGGTGGTNGAQTVTGTTGNGVKFQASVTVAGNAITAVLSITVGGSYKINPDLLTAEPVTGANLSGAQLSVVMGVDTVAGKAGSLGSYTAVPSNPVTQASTTGTGTGATLTVTWLRDNLVTTIQSRTSATQVVLAANASATVTGALWGYGSDYTTQINTAIAVGPTTLPTGLCGIASTVSISNRQVVIGQGTGGGGSGPSNLLWLGAVGGTVLKADNASTVNGARIGPFNIMGLGAASVGASFRGLQQSRADLHVTAVKDWAFKLEEASAGGHDTYFNDFRLVAAVNAPYPGSRNAIGIAFPKATVSAGAHDVNGNNFYNTAVYHQDGVGIDLEEGYMNNFYLTQLFGTGNGWGVRFGGTSVNGFERAHGNNFYDFISQAPVLAEGGTFPSIGNIIDPYDTQAYNPGVTMQTGATLYCVTNGTSSNGGDRGRNLCTAPANSQVSGGSSGNITDSTNYRAISVGAFIPRYTGNMTLWATGAATNDTAADGGLVTMYYGTGTAPTVGADLSAAGATRFNCGGFPGMINPAAAVITSAVSVKCDIQDFGRGITWWYAFGGKRLSGGNFSVTNTYISAKEDP